jgi:Methyltransferase FkbM domain
VPIAETSEPAKALRLDDVCLELPRIQLLKIDIEGHELEVLESARKTIAYHQSEICVEAFPESFPAANDLLASWGYVFAKELSNCNYYFVAIGPRASHARAKFRLLLPKFIRSRARSHLLAYACAWPSMLQAPTCSDSSRPTPGIQEL